MQDKRISSSPFKLWTSSQMRSIYTCDRGVLNYEQRVVLDILAASGDVERNINDNSRPVSNQIGCYVSETSIVLSLNLTQTVTHSVDLTIKKSRCHFLSQHWQAHTELEQPYDEACFSCDSVATLIARFLFRLKLAAREGCGQYEALWGMYTHSCLSSFLWIGFPGKYGETQMSAITVIIYIDHYIVTAAASCISSYSSRSAFENLTSLSSTADRFSHSAVLRSWSQSSAIVRAQRPVKLLT